MIFTKSKRRNKRFNFSIGLVIDNFYMLKENY